MKGIAEAIESVIRTYPGWTMFCIVILVFAIAHRIESCR